MAISISSSFKTCILFLSLLSFFLFFLLTTPTPNSPNYPSPSLITTPHRSLIATAAKTPPCSSAAVTHSDGLFNYLYLHFCLFRQNPFFSLSSLSLILLLLFYILIKTAQDHFSLVTTKLVFALDLTPSMAAVTLLALGNGAPDVFASVAAVRTGQYRTGFGAILSAGTFVSAFVVGFVAIYAAPFPLKPAPFVRDVMFYLTAALFLFYVYLSAEIYLWQAVGFVGFYLFFVGLVFWMDRGRLSDKKGKGPKLELRIVDVRTLLVSLALEISPTLKLHGAQDGHVELDGIFAIGCLDRETRMALRHSDKGHGCDLLRGLTVLDLLLRH